METPDDSGEAEDDEEGQRMELGSEGEGEGEIEVENENEDEQEDVNMADDRVCDDCSWKCSAGYARRMQFRGRSL